jgi:hypothetical protein
MPVVEEAWRVESKSRASTLDEQRTLVSFGTL